MINRKKEFIPAQIKYDIQKYKEKEKRKRYIYANLR